MTRVSGITALATLIVLAAASAGQAQNGKSLPPPGTNSAGTAQSSELGPNRAPGVTTGSAAPGSGRSATGPTMSPEAAINAENNTIDRKLKGICRGC